jgi:hypothetical protein
MTPFIIFVGSSEFRHSLSLCGENRVLLFHKAMLMPTSASRVRYSSTLLRLSIASFSPSAYRIMASSPSSLSRASVSFAKQKQRTYRRRFHRWAARRQGGATASTGGHRSASASSPGPPLRVSNGSSESYPLSVLCFCSGLYTHSGLCMSSQEMVEMLKVVFFLDE